MENSLNASSYTLGGLTGSTFGQWDCRPKATGKAHISACKAEWTGQNPESEQAELEGYYLMIDGEKDALLDRIVQFLLDIGFQFREVELNQQTFVPGIAIGHGMLLIDKSKLLYPGDLLHEAGHLAVIPAEKRARVQGDVGKKAAEEMMAIAWSYAAAVHLGLEASDVFHEGGYKGGSASLIENFTNGRYIGVPMLQWIGLTVDDQRAREMGIEPYPCMIKWVLD